MNERKRNYIVNTINHLVRTSGYPVAGITLGQIGIATRKELRKLKRDGVLVECFTTSGRTLLKAYYTEGEIPDAIKNGRADDHKRTDATEVVEGRATSTG